MLHEYLYWILLIFISLQLQLLLLSRITSSVFLVLEDEFSKVQTFWRLWKPKCHFNNFYYFLNRVFIPKYLARQERYLVPKYYLRSNKMLLSVFWWKKILSCLSLRIQTYIGVPHAGQPHGKMFSKAALVKMPGVMFCHRADWSNAAQKVLGKDPLS